MAASVLRRTQRMKVIKIPREVKNRNAANKLWKDTV